MAISKELRATVGGSITNIPLPNFPNMFTDEKGKPQKYVAYCNEEGDLKNLPQNMSAFAMMLPFRIVGDIAIVTGDDKFMKQKQ